MSLRGGIGAWRWLAALCLLLAPVLAPAATILVFGDSISAGYGLESGRGWVALLQQKLDSKSPGQHHVVNGSLSGETTAGGRRRLPPLLQKHRPDIVVLELGGNDGLRGLSPAAMADNLRAMIRAARGAGARVVLLGVRMPPNYGRAFAEAFENGFARVSREERVPLLPFFLDDGKGGIVALQPDGIHPVAAAQPRLLANAWPLLEQALRQHR